MILKLLELWRKNSLHFFSYIIKKIVYSSRATRRAVSGSVDKKIDFNNTLLMCYAKRCIASRPFSIGAKRHTQNMRICLHLTMKKRINAVPHFVPKLARFLLYKRSIFCWTNFVFEQSPLFGYWSLRTLLF